MHAVVLRRDELDVVVGESVDLQLERQRWLQVTIDRILFELHMREK